MTIDDSPTRGFLIPIGGAERKRKSPTILRRFIDVCGGPDSRIAIIPTGMTSQRITAPK